MLQTGTGQPESNQHVLGLPTSQHLLVYKEGAEFHLQHKGKNYLIIVFVS